MAIAINYAQVHRRSPGQNRITFGESLDGEIVWRMAVGMTDADIMGLRDVLNELFPPPEKQN